jgi:hypothetical protein
MTDAALQTAREVLDGCICECGHLASSHSTMPTDGDLTDCGGDNDEGGCGCCEFTPVLFTVARLDQVDVEDRAAALAALQQIADVEGRDPDGVHDTWSDIAARCIAITRAAIAKAEGR